MEERTYVPVWAEFIRDDQTAQDSIVELMSEPVENAMDLYNKLMNMEEYVSILEDGYGDMSDHDRSDLCRIATVFCKEINRELIAAAAGELLDRAAAAESVKELDKVLKLAKGMKVLTEYPMYEDDKGLLRQYTMSVEFAVNMFMNSRMKK